MAELSATQRAKRLEANLLKCWDARVVHYDPEEFPFHEWIRKRINKMG